MRKCPLKELPLFVVLKINRGSMRLKVEYKVTPTEWIEKNVEMVAQ
jgi:hypothetical protein